MLIPHGFDGFASRDMRHCHLLEQRRHDMMRPYVVLPRRLPTAPHAAPTPDARIRGRPPSP
jgi:hypothetical protein